MNKKENVSCETKPKTRRCKEMYVMLTSWGYGVFKGNILQMEFETESEAYAYIEKTKEEKRNGN